MRSVLAASTQHWFQHDAEVLEGLEMMLRCSGFQDHAEVLEGFNMLLRCFRIVIQGPGALQESVGKSCVC